MYARRISLKIFLKFLLGIQSIFFPQALDEANKGFIKELKEEQRLERMRELKGWYMNQVDYRIFQANMFCQGSIPSFLVLISCGRGTEVSLMVLQL